MRPGATIDPKVFASWEKFLNPDSLKSNLVTCGVYLAAYEMFKNSLVGYPRTFYTNGFDEDGDILSQGYDADVLSLAPKKRIFNASALWWKKHGVLTDDEVKIAHAIRIHRDAIAHDIPKFLGDADHRPDIELLEAIFALISKIDKWWILEVEVPTNPDFDDKELSDEDRENTYSANMMLLSLMIPVAQGDDSRLRTIYEGWLQAAKQAGAKKEA